MQITNFKDQINLAGLARSYNWICRIYPPRMLSSLTQQMQVQTNINQGGNRVNLNLPGFSVGANVSDTWPIGDIGTASLNLGNINLGLPNSGFTLSNIGGVLESLNLYCSSCSIPERDIENVEWSEYGEKRMLGARHSHRPFGVKYYCSENLFERFFFEQWQELIFNSNSKQYGFYDDYISNIEILKYDAGWKNVTAIYRLEEAYPSNVGSLPLNHADNSILQLDISFKYRKYTRIK